MAKHRGVPRGEHHMGEHHHKASGSHHGGHHSAHHGKHVMSGAMEHLNKEHEGHDDHHRAHGHKSHKC